MDVEGSNNPFFSFLLSVQWDYLGKTMYLPNDKTVEVLFKKLGIDASAFVFEEGSKYSKRLKMVLHSFFELWSDENEFDYDEKTKKVAYRYKISFRVTSEISLNRMTVRFLGGWLGHEANGKYLSRLLKRDSENENNPFNYFSKYNRYRRFNAAYLPDSTYLVELYKRLGVKDFEDMRISRVEYEEAFKEFQFQFDSATNVTVYDRDGNSQSIYVLWIADAENTIYYLQEFPEKVLTNLGFYIMRNRGQIPAEEWKKDPFLEMAAKNLKGKDLLSLCVSNARFNSLCNQNDQKIFKDALQAEFGVDWEQTHHDFANPRELYRQMHTLYFLMDRATLRTRVIADGHGSVALWHQSIFVPRFSLKDAEGFSHYGIVILKDNIPASFCFSISNEEEIKVYDTEELRKTFTGDIIEEIARPLYDAEMNGAEVPDLTPLFAWIPYEDDGARVVMKFI